ncbi:MAG: type I secretion C-terminal target domain-containing protein [Alphaproteobacteria bacterium]|nr:type I secretion C-terminal target domain-containing protein [Alphaproteobacteria bacterium]
MTVATIYYNLNFNFLTDALRLGTVVGDPGATEFAIAHSGALLVVRGSGFTFDATGRPQAGEAARATSMALLLEFRQAPLLTLEEFDINMAQLLSSALDRQYGAVFDLFFAGDDIVRLGPGYTGSFAPGTGADTYFGNANNGTYQLDDAGDRVIETANGGERDRVELTYGAAGETLPAIALGSGRFAGIEQLRYLGQANDTLTGGSGNDVLDGGAGRDRMIGGAGDDLYIVDDAGDRIVEGAQQGFDNVEVRGLAAWTLGANLEGLRYVGQGNFRGAGNGLHNYIEGGDGADTLSGAAGNDTLVGGAGADLLTGGTGADVFRLLADGASDTVTDFSRAQGDRIDIRSLLQDLPAGGLADLVAGGYLRFAAQGGDLGIYFDRDGAAGGGEELLAGVLRGQAGLVLQAEDFILF